MNILSVALFFPVWRLQSKVSELIVNQSTSELPLQVSTCLLTTLFLTLLIHQW